MTTLTPPKTSFAALMRLAGPIFVANIAIVGSGTIDTIMAGQLGKNHLAAIAVSIAATISVVMGLAGILQSLSPIAGHHYGARNYRAVGEELEQNFWLGGFLCLFGVPLLMYTELWISLGKVEGEVARMAAEFLFFTALALPACLFARTFISVNAALSRPRITMWVSLAMLALKVPLNGIFMYGWLGFPAMGGSGAGVSFCILNYLAFLCYLAIWKRDAFYRTMHAERIFGPRWALMKEQLHVGIPIGLSTFFEVSSFTLMAIFVARFGSEAVSAHQIVANITSLCYMLPLSIGIASSVLISQCLGARWPAVAYTVLTRTLKVSVASATCIVTILFFARHWLVTLYSSDTGVCAMAASLLIFGCLYHVFDAMQSVSSFALRGYRVTRLPMIIYGVTFCILNYLAFLCYLAIWKRDAFYRTMHAERIFGPRWALMKEQLHVGIPIGLSTFFEVSSFTLMAIFVARFGSEAVSAHQIVANITSLCYMLPLSIGIASSVLISQCLGARWPAVAYTVLTRTLKVSVASATCIVTILFFARHWLVTLYSSDTGVCAMAASLLIFGCLYHVFDAMQSVSSFALRGYRVTRLPMIIYGVMLWGVGLGGGYMLAFGNPITGEPMGAYGFWSATAAGLWLTGISLACMAIWVGRQFARDDNHTPEEIEEAVKVSRA